MDGRHLEPRGGLQRPVRRLHDTAFFFKQWGAWGKDGRTYRGRTWDEMPMAAPVSRSRLSET